MRDSVKSLMMEKFKHLPISSDSVVNRGAGSRLICVLGQKWVESTSGRSVASGGVSAAPPARLHRGKKQKLEFKKKGKTCKLGWVSCICQSLFKVYEPASIDLNLNIIPTFFNLIIQIVDSNSIHFCHCQIWSWCFNFWSTLFWLVCYFCVFVAVVGYITL